MSVVHLDRFFAPSSVAVVGASARDGSVGATVWRNLRDGGFAGARWAVNLKGGEIDGQTVHAGLGGLPDAPDLAVLCTPPASVPGLVAELGALGTRAVVVLTAGLDHEQGQSTLQAARVHRLRILGPNGLGLLSTPSGLNASFAHAGARGGGLAFVSQSGALLAAMLDWGRARGIGFSRCVSLGEQLDVDFGDMLDWLASDPKTQAVMLYAEALSSARKFMSAARAAARNKPVIVVKSGRSEAGQRATVSHTGALAGNDWVVDAAIRRAGMLRVDTLDELFVAAETMAHFRAATARLDGAPPPPVTIVTNGGGAGVLAADEVARRGLELAPLAEPLQARLDALLPANWSRANPVDLIGDAPVARYVGALEALLACPQTGTLLFIHAPTAIVPSADIAAALVPLARAHPARLVSCWLGGDAVREARQRFTDAGVPTHDTPEQAVSALAMLATYRRNQAVLMEVPPTAASAPAPDGATVRRLVDEALAGGREWLRGPDAMALVAACGVACVPTLAVADDADAAVRAARQLGYPVAVKVVSAQISHKTDVGGVALDLHDDDAVHRAIDAMRRRVGAARPDAVVEGYAVEPMVRRPQALELIVGTHVDPVFGPVILFGEGGTRVEAVADRALGLPPLNAPLARELISRTRIARLLAGWRDVPAADAGAVAGALVALSQLLAQEPRIAELDINPLLADARGIVALDARVRVSAAAPAGVARFAIRPYPQELVEVFEWQGRQATLRPIRPEDEAQHLAFLERVAPDDLRLRLFHARRSIERSELARLTQIDYEREMALVVTIADAPGGEQTLGVVRAFVDPDNVQAEFGILVRSDVKHTGLGRRLMERLIALLRARSTRRLVATVLDENAAMLGLAAALGFVAWRDEADPGVRHVALELASEPGVRA